MAMNDYGNGFEDRERDPRAQTPLQAAMGGSYRAPVDPTTPIEGGTAGAGGAGGAAEPKKASAATIGSLMPNLRANYNHTPQDLQRAFAEHPEWFEGASIMGSKGDKVKFADGNIYDIIQAAGAGGRGWQELWDNDPNKPAAPAMGAGGPMIGGGFSPEMLSGTSGFFEQLMQRLAAQSGTSDTNAALRAALGGR